MDFDEWWEESGAWEMRKIRDIGEAAWNAAIQSRLHQKEGAIEAPSQEPAAWLVKFNARLNGLAITDKLCVWRKEDATKQVQDFLIQSVEPLYTHQSDAAAQIESLKAQLEGAKVMYEAMSYKADDAAAQIAELQRSEELCRNAADRLRVEIEQLQAENADLKRLTQYPNNCEYVRDTLIAQLQAELTELQHCTVKQEIDKRELTAAARMALDCWECEQMLSDAVVIALRDALGDK